MLVDPRVVSFGDHGHQLGHSRGLGCDQRVDEQPELAEEEQDAVKVRFRGGDLTLGDTELLVPLIDLTGQRAMCPVTLLLQEHAL